MFQHLDIYDPKERALVGVADLALGVAALPLDAPVEVELVVEVA